MLLLGAVLVAGAAVLDVPLLAGWRRLLAPLLMAADVGLLLSTLWWVRRRWLKLALVTAALAGMVIQGVDRVTMWRVRCAAAAATDEELQAVGQHIIAGFRRDADIEELVRRRSVGGVYLTRGNVRGRSAAQLAGLVRRLQDERRRQGLPPLIVAADQEGGPVSHLTPPLASEPALGALLARTPAESWRQVTAEYAHRQGRELARVGVNLNLAPVVDLRTDVKPAFDLHSHISQRALGAEPGSVAVIAVDYCRVLAAHGVGCSLKHLPGLGAVASDVHFVLGRVTTAWDELLRGALRPYIAAAAAPELPLAFMTSHVVVETLDPGHPASLSPALVARVRGDWRFAGLLVTDDFSMQPIAGRTGGAAGAAVDALNAGMDLILVTFDPDLVHPILKSLLDARRAGTLAAPTLSASRARIARFLQQVSGEGPS